jgi:hypothetical protein
MKIGSLILFVFLLCVSNVLAGIRPSFSLDACSWNATHIVIASEGEEIDGNLTVLESLKGDLGYGEIISIPAFAAFKEDSLRQVKEWGSGTPLPSKYVSGARMILFLKKNPAAKAIWEAGDPFKDFNVSVVWVEGMDTFAFIQTVNPGSSILVDYGQTEAKIKTRVSELTELKKALDDVLSIEDTAERAAQLKKFASNDFYPAREKAFEEFEKCGENALPVLREMLDDKSLLKLHSEVIKSLAATGGKKVGSELTEIVGQELKFWRETAPKLKIGWWNKMDDPQVDALRNRYSKVLEAIRQLGSLKFGGSRKVVTQFRDYWRSLPQLEDQSGLDQMSEECDDLLRQLSSK